MSSENLRSGHSSRRGSKNCPQAKKSSSKRRMTNDHWALVLGLIHFLATRICRQIRGKRHFSVCVQLQQYSYRMCLLWQTLKSFQLEQDDSSSTVIIINNLARLSLDDRLPFSSSLGSFFSCYPEHNKNWCVCKFTIIAACVRVHCCCLELANFLPLKNERKKFFFLRRGRVERMCTSLFAYHQL